MRAAYISQKRAEIVLSMQKREEDVAARYLASLVILLFTMCAHAQSFSGSFEFRWLSEPENKHRMMQLLSPVSFTDKKGKVWSVPANWKIDGASIPQVFWTVAGSPFDGNYRRASVIHDHYCDVDTEFTKDTHDMFKEASLFDGVSFVKATAMRIAIGVGGTGCGKGDPPNTTFSNLNEVIVSGKQDDFADVLRQLDVPNSNFRTSSLPERKSAIEDLVDVEKPRTYAATVQFRASPTEENFLALQTAVDLEKPTDEDIHRIEDLVQAISPDIAPLTPADNTR
jgi:Protein of unknown function (DUF1353)